MSEEIQKWIRENFQLVERIRDRFEKYFKIRQSMRLSEQSNSSDEDISAKIQNQWRKLNDLLNKKIPEKIGKVVEQQNARNLDLLRLEALRIQNMFKNKFGQQKHNQFKLIERTESWRNPVFKSNLGNSKIKSTYVQIEQNPQQDEKKVKQSFIEESPGEEEKQMIQSLEEGERRTSSRIWRIQAEQKRSKACGYILAFTLLIVLLMSYFRIPLDTKLFTYLFQNDL